MNDKSDHETPTVVTASSAIQLPTGAYATSARSTDALTDLHNSKIPADDPRLKVERPRSRTLRRGPALIVASILGAALSTALVLALTQSSSASDEKKPGALEVNTTVPVPLPDMLTAPAEPRPVSRPPLGGPTLDGSHATTPQLKGEDSGRRTFRQTDAAREARAEELTRALGATLFAQTEDAPLSEPQSATRPNPSGAGAPGDERSPAGSAAGSANPSRARTPTCRSARTTSSRAPASARPSTSRSRSPRPAAPTRSRPARRSRRSSITGINSDLPGQIVGQVRENVYDTVTGNYLLIPQGSRLLAAYDSMVAWGQERVLVCWHRLIRPDGSSITLDCMPGVDLAGYAGFADEVDNHWWKIITGAAFGSLLAATAQRSQGDVSRLPADVPAGLGRNAAGHINQAGQQLTQRNLQIQPTITIRPGFSVNVLVTKDIIVPPYSR